MEIKENGRGEKCDLVAREENAHIRELHEVHPLNFKRTKELSALIRWFEKMDEVFTYQQICANIEVLSLSMLLALLVNSALSGRELTQREPLELMLHLPCHGESS
ncbi:hypothetical protein Tco_0223320 [Tanacetum coccineum]